MSTVFLNHIVKTSLLALITLLLHKTLRKRLHPEQRLWLWLPLAVRSILPVDFISVAHALKINILPDSRTTDHRLIYIFFAIYLIGLVSGLLRYLYASRKLKSLLIKNRRALIHDEIPYPIYLSPYIENALVISSSGSYEIYIHPKYFENEKISRHILYHEAAHAVQHAPRYNLLRLVVLLLHWYNPLYWLCAREIAWDFECAADSLALEKLGEGETTSFAETLIDLSTVASVKAGPKLSSSNALFKNRREIKYRLLTLIECRNKKTKFYVLPLLVMLVLLAFLSTKVSSHDISKQAVLPPESKPVIQTK